MPGIALSFQAPTLAEAGAKLDDVLTRARERGDIELRSLDLQTPSTGAPVTIPYATSPLPASKVPDPLLDERS